MRRYLLFHGTIYYPSGGMHDFEGDFDSIEEAVEKLKALLDPLGDSQYSWFQIYDQVELKDVDIQLIQPVPVPPAI